MIRVLGMGVCILNVVRANESEGKGGSLAFYLLALKALTASKLIYPVAADSFTEPASLVFQYRLDTSISAGILQTTSARQGL